MDFSRVDRLQSQMVRDLAAVIVEDLKDNIPYMLTFTRVEITKDLKYAKVFFSVLGKEKAVEESLDFLKRHNGVIRKMLGNRMRIRRIPELLFRYDSSTDHVLRVNELLKESKKREEDS